MTVLGVVAGGTRTSCGIRPLARPRATRWSPSGTGVPTGCHVGEALPMPDVTPTDVEMDPTPDGGEPNEQEKLSLRRVGENLPAPAYLIAIVELTERFT